MTVWVVYAIAITMVAIVQSWAIARLQTKLRETDVVLDKAVAAMVKAIPLILATRLVKRPVTTERPTGLEHHNGDGEPTRIL